MLADLTREEQRLIEAAAEGDWLDLRTAATDTIRAAVVEEVLLGKRDGPVRAVKLVGARIVGALNLEAVTLPGPCWLVDCRLDDVVNLREAQAPSIRLTRSRVCELLAEQLQVRGSVDLAGLVTAGDEVRLLGADIGGSLYLSGARLTNPEGYALAADNLVIGQNLFARDGFVSRGSVRLAGARIGGTLELDGARLSAPGADVLSADGLVVGQDAFCRDGFRAEGEVRLVGAQIGGTLSCSAATLSNPDGRALNLDSATVSQDLFLRRDCVVEGEIRLVGAKVGGSLILSTARLTGAHGSAVAADDLSVGRSMFARTGFTCEGTLGLAGARIGGLLDLGGAMVNCDGGVALDASGLVVGESLVCGEGFAARGDLTFAGCRVAGDLVFRPSSAPTGVLDLTNAAVRSYSDDPATWPDRLELRGFAYETLVNDRITTRQRLRWVERHRGYTPGVYDQLAEAYRRMGRVEAARTAKLARQWRRRRVLNPVGRAWNWLLYLTVGYGYRTWLAAVWLLALLLVGAFVLDPAQLHPAVANPPSLNRVAYTLDVLLPVIDLGQDKAWVAGGVAQVWAWALTASGWLLTTTVVAGLTNALKRD
ncbi:hypothetical protein [Amycolatopsis minnesotensis]